MEYCKVDGALYQVVYREDGTVDMCPFRVVPRNEKLKVCVCGVWVGCVGGLCVVCV